MQETEKHIWDDHNTLIRIEEQVKNLTEKVSALTDDHEKRLRFLEDEKINKKDFVLLQRIAYGGIGVVFFLELYLRFFPSK